ncbi:MAG TPA: adenosylmethionine--8-amino-7-oxononanoate transaminase [Ignavibacteriales bacterium]|nr:adenosylmethionine--8-amino-7-oxononanoate transaminase [Ignavibacteriales bacterium]HOL80487.1 adenosylmethionine--8-amino-7-oxononanoate transaminase [Ignavibacteriales bacterium]HOM64938.1 adenosylmethionine--8-amino-7-oxononanoate transaminase [Ignavibacteriales bacterium]HPD67959.1 adenosylmethionine--8-amino-7-oxononanoate transaminase [Ignavibacteriales bacterium]HPP32677.1 adenosylmethionine--8-amino-7-oxononanoate transaminase [Ignavibacteriales bacterium]
MLSRHKTLKIDRENIWHPFTQMKRFEFIDHKVIVKAKGLKLYDYDGKEYYDAISSWWTNIHGHNKKEINDAIKDQLKELDHTLFAGITHPYAAEVVDRLKFYLPHKLNKFFFSDNGSTAVEVALKMAFQYWQNIGKTTKTKFAYLDNSYHGDTIGSISVGGVDLYHKLYNPLRFDAFRLKQPKCSTCPFRKSNLTYDAKETGCNIECLDETEKLLTKKHEQIAAVIVEPLVQGSTGMNIYNPEYLNRLFRLCKDLDILVIFDEVATGFGRTGTMFALEQTNVIPDIITISKGITGGYLPLSLTITNPRIYSAFYDDDIYKTLFHGHSYTANPIACSAAIANLKLFREENLPESRSKFLAYFHSQVKELSKYDFVGDVRYLGFIGAIDIVKDKTTKEKFGSNFDFKVNQTCLKNGVLIRPLDGTVYWFLPLSTKKSEVDEILDRTIKSIKEVIDKI